MDQTTRPRRSVLYMPGSNARALEKAKTLPADGLILDLEDAVAPDAKDVARTQVCEAVKDGGYGKRELIIRVNGLDTPWGEDDIAAACEAGPDAILMPKVESAGMIGQLETRMVKNGAPDTTAVWCMMETPMGILRAAEIAGASRRIACLVMGTSDLTKDLHARHTADRGPMMASLSHCLLAARAFGLSIVDGVHLNLADDQEFRTHCLQGLDMGFDGKTLIHPKQVTPCNEVFAPTADEVDDARRIIAAFTEAEKEGKGVVVVDGRLIENLHVENAKRLVALSDAIEELAAAAEA